MKLLPRPKNNSAELTNKVALTDEMKEDFFSYCVGNEIDNAIILISQLKKDDQKILVNQKDMLGNTIIHYSDDITLVGWLLKKGANLNTKNNEGKTPLHYAVIDNKYDYVIDNKYDYFKFLLKKGANLNTQDNEGKTPLYYALIDDKYDYFKLLLEKGANLNTQDNEGKTLLHCAVMNRRNNFIQLLLHNNADVDLKNLYGETPLHYAAKAGSLSISKYLIKYKADISSVNDYGENFLHYVIAFGSKNIIQDIVQNKEQWQFFREGVNLDLPSLDGNTALHYVAIGGNNRLLKFLLEEGANPDIKNKQGQTALDIAGLLGRDQFIEIFNNFKDKSLKLSSSSAFENVSQTKQNKPGTSPKTKYHSALDGSKSFINLK